MLIRAETVIRTNAKGNIVTNGSECLFTSKCRPSAAKRGQNYQNALQKNPQQTVMETRQENMTVTHNQRYSSPELNRTFNMHMNPNLAGYVSTPGTCHIQAGDLKARDERGRRESERKCFLSNKLIEYHLLWMWEQASEIKASSVLDMPTHSYVCVCVYVVGVGEL